MNKEGMISVNQNGVDINIYAIGSFKLENGSEYVLYHLENDDNIQASRIVETEDNLNLYEITDDEFTLVQEVINSILEGK